jgi:hypothetical protein
MPFLTKCLTFHESNQGSAHLNETRDDMILPDAMKPADDVGALIDEVGKRYGRLTVIERSGTKRREATWKCLCACGVSTTATGHALRRGKRRSCGCRWRATEHLRAKLCRHQSPKKETNEHRKPLATRL